MCVISAPAFLPATIWIVVPGERPPISSTMRSASACEAAKAKPVGPQELWPIPTGSCLRQAMQYCLDLLAGEHAALCRRKVVTDLGLDRFHSPAERGNILFDQGRHQAHQNVAADQGRGGSWERRQRPERFDLGLAVNALCKGVKHENDAPVLRKRNARDDRRSLAAMSLARIDNHAAFFESGNADPRPRTTPEQGGIISYVQRQGM